MVKYVEMLMVCLLAFGLGGGMWLVMAVTQ